MALPVSYASITLADYTERANGQPETTTTQFPIITLTPGNVAATSTLVGNLRTALAAIVLGRFIKNELTYARNETGEPIPADDQNAQRENKWLCRYHDATNFKKFQMSFGTADLSQLADHQETLDLTAGVGADFKDAFEAVVVSPYDAANSVVLDSMQFVGRNT